MRTNCREVHECCKIKDWIPLLLKDPRKTDAEGYLFCGPDGLYAWLTAEKKWVLDEQQF